ncbi:hypothetical protein B0H11DRAFT_1014906 [Mycena galericulata]|nr:hypothetical protein B0H11DRAFT_1014906 [Mycena galericulata]
MALVKVTRPRELRTLLVMSFSPILCRRRPPSWIPITDTLCSWHSVPESLRLHPKELGLWLEIISLTRRRVSESSPLSLRENVHFLSLSFARYPQLSPSISKYIIRHSRALCVRWHWAHFLSWLPATIGIRQLRRFRMASVALVPGHPHLMVFSSIAATPLILVLALRVS